ncbi:hypothetical protein [Halioglobus sp. HI00S01]|uniref:hypothetical protein n=1 Tax=Halioglobus sp. HI00S01 TaxID=1822214 RepID=UPI0012E96C75|nr:hypothetical protein [Halioglobus sp. HI00S01]
MSTVIQASGAGDVTLEKVAEGRYVVRRGGLRQGEVFGGHGRWVAQTLRGRHLGTAKNRHAAARLALSPSSNSDGKCVPQFNQESN